MAYDQRANCGSAKFVRHRKKTQKGLKKTELFLRVRFLRVREFFEVFDIVHIETTPKGDFSRSYT